MKFVEEKDSNEEHFVFLKDSCRSCTTEGFMLNTSSSDLNDASDQQEETDRASDREIICFVLSLHLMHQLTLL